MALTALLVSPVRTPPVDAATSPTVVTIQFDDGNANQYGALALLNTYGMDATFYVNSGVVGDATHLSWAQLSDLAAAGNEIASHTLFHTNIKKLKTAQARQAVCGDRVNLWNHGFQAVSFAYPFGSFDSGSKAVVQACGFNSGRGVSGVNDRKVFAETIKPLDAYATRTPPNPKQGTTVATIEGYVTAAQTHGGGWVAARVPQPLRSMRRLFHHPDRLHIFARMAPITGNRRGQCGNDGSSGRWCGAPDRATLIIRACRFAVGFRRRDESRLDRKGRGVPCKDEEW